MNTVRFLFGDPTLAELAWPGVVAGLGLALMCALLSPLAVLKRMGFVGQGISHAGFGGVGIAAMLLAVTGGAGAMGRFVADPAGQFAIVLAFCLGAALLIARLIERGRSQADTAIAIVLVGSMTLGAVLLALAVRRGLPQARAWESLLFGDIFSVSSADAAIAWAAAAIIAATLWWLRRPMLFWAFDEHAAPAFGVRDRAMKYVLVVLLGVAIVTAMKLAGVVLATALLVLPGAIALRLSERWGTVLALSAAAALVGVVGGLVASFEADLPPGACMVGVMVGLYVVARLVPIDRGVRTPAKAG